HHLGDARAHAEPYRRAYHEDVRRLDLVEDQRPLVPLALVGRHAERDPVVDDPNHLALDVHLVEPLDHLPGKPFRVRDGRGPLEGAVQEQSPQLGHLSLQSPRRAPRRSPAPGPTPVQSRERGPRYAPRAGRHGGTLPPWRGIWSS